MKKRLAGFCMIALIVALSNSAAWAQLSSASISGRVQDTSGASVPGAKVTVRNLETAAVRTVTADDTGNYRVLTLPVGRYELKAEQTGFKATLQTGINLVVGQDAAIDLKLEIGQMEQSVTVTAEVPIVNTTTASISGLISEQQIKELPLNGRSWDMLITLNPSTVNFTTNKSKTNPSQGGNTFSVAGRRSSENVILLNGVEYIGAGSSSNTPGGASGQLLGIEGIREYNVVSDGYGAEYGKRPGGQISIVTQSGSNQLHVTLFEFIRNGALDARDYFAKTSQTFQRNQFGAAAGGPIKKDKMFVFGNYEGFRQRLSAAHVTFVPDENMRNGLLPDANGVPTSVVGLDPRILPFVRALWPAPNGPVLGGGIAQSFSNAPSSIHQDYGTVRFDYTVSNKDSLSLAYTIDDSANFVPTDDPLFANQEQPRNQVLSLQETHVFSPNVINTFTAGYARAKYTNLPWQSPSIPANLTFVLGQPVGQIIVGGSQNGGGGLALPGAPASPKTYFIHNVFTATDTLQVIRGRHELSFGGWFQKIQQNDLDPLRVPASANFTSLTTFLQAKPSQVQISPGLLAYNWRNWEGAWYAQDSIRVRKNLTVRVGLRHEFAGKWTEVNGHAVSYTFVNNEPVNGIITPPRVSNTFNTENNSKWLFSPRVGLAWDVFGNGKTSVRSAFGMYYNMQDWLAYLEDTAPPLSSNVVFTPTSLFNLLPYNPSTPLLPACTTVANSSCLVYFSHGVQSDYKIPTVEEWNLSVEQQLARSTAFRIGYVGSHNYHNWNGSDPNRIPPQICNDAAGCVAGGINAAHSTVSKGTLYVPVRASRPNPALASGLFAYTLGYGNYNALQLEVTQRLSHGLQFKVDYTWSKNLDVASSLSQGIGGTGGGADNLHFLYDMREDYGLATFGLTKQFTANFSYLLPFGQGRSGFRGKLIGGWQLNGIVTALSGFPMTVATGGNPSGDGDANGVDRPNWAPGFSGNPTHGVTAGCGNGIIPAGQPLHTAARWYDPCAFTLPASGTFGNVSRNSIIGPPLATLNMSLYKNTKISERINTQFRVEAFNLFNHPNFRIPQSGNPIAFNGSAYSATSGVIQDTATDMRQIQFGLKIMF